MKLKRAGFLFICRIMTVGFAICLNLTLTQNLQAIDASYKLDFDGDGKTDIAVYREGERTFPPFLPSYFYVLGSQSGQLISYQWGRAFDTRASADYDNDGKTDFGIFRTLDENPKILMGDYWIKYSSGGHSATPFNLHGYFVGRNYYDDGKAEIAIFSWYNASKDPEKYCWILAYNIKIAGIESAYRKDVIDNCASESQRFSPAPGDYNNDGKSDVGVFVRSLSQPSTFESYFNVWYSPVLTQYTLPDVTQSLDIESPFPGDYDGDGKDDFAGTKNINGTRLWRIKKSSNGDIIEVSFGFSSDKPVPGDYDGDQKTDLAVFRPSNSTWYISRSSDGALASYVFGLSTDVPIAFPTYYNP